MKPDAYYAWKNTPTPVIAPEWRAAAAAPRRKGVRGALSALAARLWPDV
jgi:hypothetical protein